MSSLSQSPVFAESPARMRDMAAPLEPPVPAAGAALRDVLQGPAARLEQSERLQRALFAIADLASADLEMTKVYSSLHAIVGSLMYAENFYIALYNDLRQTLRFPYFVDVADSEVPTPEQEF